MSAMMNTIYLSAVILYVLAWCVTLGGLSATQHYCFEAVDKNDSMTLPIFMGLEGNQLLSAFIGDKCSKLFRFPWFIFCLGLLPLIAEGLAFLRSTRAFGSAATPFAFIAVLNILVANMFYNFADMADKADLSGKFQDRISTTLAGFAMSAGLAMLCMLLSPLVAETTGPEMKSFTTAAENKAAQSAV